MTSAPDCCITFFDIISTSRFSFRRQGSRFKADSLIDKIKYLYSTSDKYTYLMLQEKNIQGSAKNYNRIKRIKRSGFSYVCREPRNGQLAKMGCFHQFLLLSFFMVSFAVRSQVICCGSKVGYFY